jgi:Fe-S oxidoreductase
VERVLEAIDVSGAERILVLCPHCAASLGADYVEVGDLTAEPVSLPSFLAELVAEGRLEFGSGPDVTVTYHDPCRLARWLDEVDPARAVLGAMPGVELVEMERNGEWGWCCGAGGWASEIVPELASFTAGERIEEARRTGADQIVTGCSYCTRMLARKSGKKQPVRHVVEVAAGRLKK